MYLTCNIHFKTVDLESFCLLFICHLNFTFPSSLILSLRLSKSKKKPSHFFTEQWYRARDVSSDSPLLSPGSFRQVAMMHRMTAVFWSHLCAWMCWCHSVNLLPKGISLQSSPVYNQMCASVCEAKNIEIQQKMDKYCMLPYILTPLLAGCDLYSS